jgi:RES domain-containing protein
VANRFFWRISRHRDLTGAGGLRAPGRWHHAGQSVVYLADSPSGALLEVCVHTSADDIPPDFTLLKIEASGQKADVIRREGLPVNWVTDITATRDIGTAWLRKGSGALLQVPGVIVPETVNFLLNPLHADAARFRVSDIFNWPLDVRLKK